MKKQYEKGGFMILGDGIYLNEFFEYSFNNYIVINNDVIFYDCPKYKYEDIKKACDKQMLFNDFNIIVSNEYRLVKVLKDIKNIWVNSRNEVCNLSDLSTSYLEIIIFDYEHKEWIIDDRYYEILHEIRHRKLKIIEEL